jgi:hypothetical protein
MGRQCWRRCCAVSPGISGPELRRFVLAQHHHGQVTVERLTTQLRAFGLSISKPQVIRLLIDRPEIPLHTNGSERDIRCRGQRA